MRTSDLEIDTRVRHLVSVCREVVQDCALHNVVAVFLYGSSLGELFRADSDIDIAVLDLAQDRLSWRDQARLMDALERATQRSIDLRMLRDSAPSHQEHVLSHGEVVWARDPVEVERYAREISSLVERQQEQSEGEWDRTLERLAGLASAKG